MKTPEYVFNRKVLPEVLDVGMVSAFVGKSESTVLNWINNKKLKAVKIDKSIIILRDDLFELIGMKGCKENEI